MTETTIELIKAERTRQDKLYGKQSYDPLGWLPILIEEAGEVSKEVCDGYHKYTGNYNTDALRTELVHVAAVAVAWIEDIDRKSQEKKGGPRMTVEEVLKEYANNNGFDGLFGDGCGCSIDHPCGCDGFECEFGYVCPCQTCEADLRTNCAAYNGGDFEYMVLPEKCEMRLKIEGEKV
jgi:NTP pyrophosphatase (non-canonical NTP hydrolase)